MKKGRGTAAMLTLGRTGEFGCCDGKTGNVRVHGILHSVGSMLRGFGMPFGDRLRTTHSYFSR